MAIKDRITFHVSKEFAAIVVAWEQAVNWQILRYTIEKRGAAAVIRFREQKGLQPLKKVPALGEAEPHYGDYGGGFAYSFYPEADVSGCVMQVTHATALGRELGQFLEWQPGRSALRPGSIGLNSYERVIPPLVLHIPRCWQMEMVQGPERWDSPQLLTERTVLEASAEEFYFWIDGRMMARLLDWGWKEAFYEQYSYHFYPLSVGCELWVVRQDAGDMISLTAGVVW